MSKDKVRCPWVNFKNPKYIKCHDIEWGRPVRRDHKHFEGLILEGAQAGLSCGRRFLIKEMLTGNFL